MLVIIIEFLIVGDSSVKNFSTKIMIRGGMLMKIKLFVVIVFILMAFITLSAFSFPFGKSHVKNSSPLFGSKEINSPSVPFVEVSEGVYAYQKTGAAGTGQVMGQATDPKLNIPVVAVVIDLYLLDGTLVDSANSDADGNFTFLNLDYDDYLLVVDDPAFRKLDLYFTVETDTLVQLPPVWLVPQEVITIGDIGGKVKDVLTGFDINLVDLDFKHGIDPPDAEPVVFTTQTSGTWNNYNYIANGLESGVYTAYASKSGYRSERFHVYVLGAENIVPQNGFLSPQLFGDEMRIVLTWGFLPADLDSHIWAPDPFGSSKVHLYYALLGAHPWGMWFDLDLDDTLHFGPETTTIRQWEPETYCFAVHDYTNRNLTFTDKMSNSGARVAVLTATDTTFFYVTPNTLATVWEVFTIDGATKQLTPVNTYGFEPNPDTVGINCIWL